MRRRRQFPGLWKARRAGAGQSLGLFTPAAASAQEIAVGCRSTVIDWPVAQDSGCGRAETMNAGAWSPPGSSGYRNEAMRSTVSSTSLVEMLVSWRDSLPAQMLLTVLPPEVLD